MPRSCIAQMATAGRETAGAGRLPEAAQASIDAFFDGDSSVFAVEPCVWDSEESPESGSTVIALAPAA